MVRTHANRQIARVKLLFKWAVSVEMLPPSVHQALATVPGLKRGRTGARETRPVKPVPQAHVDAVLPLVSRQVKAMIELQLLTGMRPSEVCMMRGSDLETTDPAKPGGVWKYRPARHKTQHHGFTRDIHLGPQAQAVLWPFLKSDLSAYLFSPAEAEAERLEARRKARNPKTPMTPSQRLRMDRAAKRERRRGPRPLRP